MPISLYLYQYYITSNILILKFLLFENYTLKLDFSMFLQISSGHRLFTLLFGMKNQRDKLMYSLTFHERSLANKCVCGVYVRICVYVCICVFVCKFFVFIAIPQPPNSNILLDFFKKHILGYKTLF